MVGCTMPRIVRDRNFGSYQAAAQSLKYHHHLPPGILISTLGALGPQGNGGIRSQRVRPIFSILDGLGMTRGKLRSDFRLA